MKEKILVSEFLLSDKPSKKFQSVCTAISEILLPLGFKYRKSSNDVIKRDTDFVYIIKFSRTRKINPIVFNVNICVQSDVIKSWQQSCGDVIADGKIVDIPLVSLTRRKELFSHYEFRTVSDAQEVVDDIVMQIKRYALLFFKRFSNINKLLNDVEQSCLLPHRPDISANIELRLLKEWLLEKKEESFVKNNSNSIESFQAQVKQLVVEGSDIEDYKNTLLAYKDFLEALVQEDKCNIKAINQLAIVYTELYEPGGRALALLDGVLNDQDDNLNEKEKVELYTNLAMLYDYDIEQRQPEQALLLLEEVVSLKPKFANPYNALAIIYAEQEKYEKALELLEKAISLDDLSLYKYNYAVCLCRAGSYSKAKAVLKSISTDWRLDEDAFQAYYLLGYCHAILKEDDEAKDIADDMSTSGIKHSTITAAEIAGIYYMCGEYKKHNNFFDKYKDDHYISVDWLACYFYSLCQLNQDVKDLLFEFIEQKQRRIEELERADFSQIGEHIKKEYIDAIDIEIVDISKMYHMVTVKNIKPQIKGYVNFLRKCYFIDCPVHSK